MDGGGGQGALLLQNLLQLAAALCGFIELQRAGSLNLTFIQQHQVRVKFCSLLHVIDDQVPPEAGAGSGSDRLHCESVTNLFGFG